MQRFSKRLFSHDNPLGLKDFLRGNPVKKERIRNVGRTVLVASGKGGVGKSTVAGANA